MSVINYEDDSLTLKESFINCGKLRWKITDEFGWNINKSDLRDMTIDKILDNKINYNCNYYISLRKPDEEGWGYYSITLKPYTNKLKLSGDVLNVTLNCKSLIDAEVLVNMLIEGNDLELLNNSKCGI